MTSRRKLNGFLLSLAMMTLASCSSTTERNYAELAEQSLKLKTDWNIEQIEAAELTQLTDLMNIPQLEKLIEQAMLHNSDLQQMLLTLKVAYAQREATNSSRIPQLTAGFDSQKDEGSNTSYAADVTVSWEVDLWNRIGNTTSAADKDISSNIANFQSVRDGLAASIMRAWLQISYRQQLRDIQAMRMAVLVNNESIILEKYRAGLGELEDLDTAKTNSATARANLNAYTETLATNQRNLRLLVGQLDGEVAADIEAEFPDVLIPMASIAVQDLSRRPDLRSAFFDIEAEGYRTQAAYKAMLPSINLSLALSDAATSPRQALFASPLWSILGQLSAPIFDAGYLQSKAEIADLTTQKAFWNYQGVLLNAVNEVENTLGQETALEKQQYYLTQAIESAERSYQNYQQKYREGLVDISDLITVQTQSFDVQAQLALVKYNRLTNRIDLGLALGLGVSQ